MIQLGRQAEKAGPMTSNDEKVESGKIIHLFLGLCYREGLEAWTHSTNSLYCSLVSFLLKHDGRSLLRSLIGTLTDELAKSVISPRYTFQIAAMIHDIDLAAAAVRLLDPWVFTSIDTTGDKVDAEDLYEGDEPANIDKSPTLDLTAVSYKQFKKYVS
ncbi:hypothetical protein I317_02833 [Kwoniella heveanensis CBS 569]|nr:hypothetical protein I317_02833 [Kwoniella heveanensis CBS 569]